jgi:glutamate racemase
MGVKKMPLNKDAPIGVFDSGVGGLTVVLEMYKQMPQESLLYYADTAHVPYGPRDPEELKGFAYHITGFLVEKGCKMIIIACNTSTSLAYEELEKIFPIPIIGVIEPGVDKALESSSQGKIGIIATQATVNSGAYQRTIKQKRSVVETIAVPCPRLVPLIEEGVLGGEEVEGAVNSYLKDMVNQGIGTLILGCTHYPFLLPLITAAAGPGISIIDPARETVSRARRALEEKGLLNEGGAPTHVFFTSGDPGKFKTLAGRLLGKNPGSVERVT